MWFQFTVGEDKPPMLSVDQSWQGRIEHGLFCEAFAILSVGVRVTITCHDLCNNRVEPGAGMGAGHGISEQPSSGRPTTNGRIAFSMGSVSMA